MTNQNKDSLRCPCGQTFQSKEELNQHQRTCTVAKQQGSKTRGAGGQTYQS